MCRVPIWFAVICGAFLFVFGAEVPAQQNTSFYPNTEVGLQDFLESALSAAKTHDDRQLQIFIGQTEIPNARD